MAIVRLVPGGLVDDSESGITRLIPGGVFQEETTTGGGSILANIELSTISSYVNTKTEIGTVDISLDKSLSLSNSNVTQFLTELILSKNLSLISNSEIVITADINIGLTNMLDNISTYNIQENLNLNTLHALLNSNIVNSNVGLTISTTPSLSSESVYNTLTSINLDLNTTLENTTGSILEVLSSLNFSSSVINDVISQIQSDIELGVIEDISNSNTEISNVSITLTNTNSNIYSATKIVAGDIEVMTTLAASHNLLLNTQINYNPTITLGIDNDLENSNTVVQYESIDIAVSNILNSSSGKNVLSTLSLGLELSSDFSSIITIEGSLLLEINNSLISSTLSEIDVYTQLSSTFLTEAVNTALQNTNISLDTVNIISLDGINPAIIVRINGEREILLTLNTKDLLIINSDKNILIT